MSSLGKEIGTRIGKLTIIGFDHEKHKYICKCDCGNIILRKSCHLNESINGKHVTSCGCNRKQDGLDLIGKKIGKLQIVSLAYHKTNWFYNCICDCGVKTIANRNCLLNGDKKTCGSCQKHGKSKTRIYRIYRAILTRCYNPNTPSWKYYGGKGVSVCDEWKEDFMAFYEWSMRNGYNNTLTIDRINVNGNYSPDNCRWTTYYVQSRNKTNNKWITYKEETKCLTDWGKSKNITSSKLYQRLSYYDWSIEKALETPPIHGRMITYKGITKNINDWSKQLKIPSKTLSNRFRLGWNIEETFETPVRDRIKLITHKGITQSLKDWSKETGISHAVLFSRLQNGWSVEATLETSVEEAKKTRPYFKNRKSITYKGVTKTITDWSKQTGIKNEIILQRLHKGWSIERALEEPLHKKKKSSQGFDLNF